MRDSGRVGDLVQDVGLHPTRETAHVGLDLLPVGKHRVNDCGGTVVGAEPGVDPDRRARRSGVAWLDVEHVGLGVAAVGVDPQHVPAPGD